MKLLRLFKGRKNAKGLILNTDFTAEEVDLNIENGSAIVNDSEFIINDSQPILIKKKGKFVNPLYILKWDSLIPMKMAIEREVITKEELEKNYDLKGEIENSMVYKRLVPMDVKFIKTKPKSKIGNVTVTPEMLKDTIDLRFLKGMKNYVSPTEKNKADFITLIILFGAGMFFMYMLMSQNIFG